MITFPNFRKATSAGYRPLTTAYHLPQEQWMLSNVIRDMRHAGIDFAVVQTSSGVEVWRKGMTTISSK